MSNQESSDNEAAFIFKWFEKEPYWQQASKLEDGRIKSFQGTIMS